MKKITLLGSTGSIGRQTLQVIERFPEELSVFALSAHSNVELFSRQIAKFKPRFAVLTDQKSYEALKGKVSQPTQLLFGNEGLQRIVSQPEVNLVVDALVGAAGLLPCLQAIQAGKDIALANKEVLVMAGQLVTKECREKNVRLIPIDSEHSGMLQCLSAGKISEVEKLIITASGGPFLNTPVEELKKVTIQQALNHPTWRMGKKITIDSATLMNKALEIIEAHLLFGIEPERIKVLIHPQSIIHSLVEFQDGSIIAQLAPPDMRLPIEYALFYPKRMPKVINNFGLSSVDKLSFQEVDLNKFKAVTFAYQVLKQGGTAPAVLNAANEMAVNLFLQEKLSFIRITEVIEEVLSRQRVEPNPNLEVILEKDRWARENTLEIAGTKL
jgi:1-deoxy-D-xylulose-5-phosphate reductoisomerase